MWGEKKGESKKVCTFRGRESHTLKSHYAKKKTPAKKVTLRTDLNLKSSRSDETEFYTMYEYE